MSPSCAYNYLQNNSENVYVQLFDASRVKENNPSTYRNVIPMDERLILFKKVTVCKRNELNRVEFPMEYYHVPIY